MVHAASFLGTNLVKGFVHVGDDMKAVEDMQGLGALLADELQIGLPHVRADKSNLRDNFLAHGGEESLKGFDGALLAYPEQAGHADIDLIDQRQLFVAFGVLDFIHADGVDLVQLAVCQAPGDDMFDGIENLIPRSAKGLGGFFPGEAARPASQEEHVGFGQGTFAVAPGHFFDHHGGTAAAVHAPHGVQQEDEKAPERDELKAPLGELVVAWSRLMAARTDRRRSLAWPQRNLNTLFVGAEPGAMIDKPPEVVAAV